MFLRKDVSIDMLDSVSGDTALECYGWLYLASYIFLLRLPSEALPITMGGSGNDAGEQAVLVVDDSTQTITLKLARRKNKYNGSCIKRSCWCLQGTPEICPYHVLGAQAKTWLPGAKPFAGITAAGALCKLRNLLQALGVPE